MESIHPIGVVVRRTGLSSHVIRAWERRHEAVIPFRSDGNHRLYSDDDIERLKLLADAVRDGASIGRIAKLPMDELRKFVRGGRQNQPAPDLPAGSSNSDPLPRVQRALAYISASDSEGLSGELADWLVQFGVTPIIENLVPELMKEIGDHWGDGRYRIHQEHMASEVVRNFLGGIFSEVSKRSGGPTVITATPPGEMHDIGALLCAIAASLEGLEVIHLGGEIPFPELIHLALQRNTLAVLLSIIFVSRDTRLVQGLESIRSMLLPETHLFIGGSSAAWYGEQTGENGIEVIPTIGELRKRLKEIQR